MTTSRANSCGRNAYVIRYRKKRPHTHIDFYNEAACARAINSGRTRTMILHPTKGYRHINTAAPTPFVGLFDWLSRCFGRVKAVKLTATLFRPAMMSQILRRAG